MSDINWHKSADLNAQRAKIEKWRSEVEEKISDLESEKEELEAERDELEADTPDESAFREKIIDDLISGRDPEGLKEVSAAFPEVLDQHDWVNIDKKRLGPLINRVSDALAHLVENLRASNNAAEKDGFLSPLQKAQLIAILKAAIEELEAPAISKSRLLGLRGWLFKISKRAVEKSATDGMQESLSDAASSVGELAKSVAPEIGGKLF